MFEGANDGIANNNNMTNSGRVATLDNDRNLSDIGNNPDNDFNPLATENNNNGITPTDDMTNYDAAQQGTINFFQYGPNSSYQLPSNITNQRPATTGTRPTVPGTAGTSAANNTNTIAGKASFETEVLTLVNKERAKQKLPALKLNANAAKAANAKASDMATKNYFSHTSPTYGSPSQLLTKFGVKWTACGENIAKGQKTPTAVMTAWMNSSGHKANIMSKNYTTLGVGCVTDTKGQLIWVQEFVK